MAYDNLIKPGYWGSIVGSDSKNNFNIGTSGFGKISHRFRASESSAITHVRWPQRWGPGYSLGTGGTMRLTLQSDNGSGSPSGTVLSQVADYSPGNPGVDSKFLNFPFITPYTVTKGTVYHIVVENVHADPANNNMSWNDIFHYDTNQHPPGLSDDYKVLCTGSAKTGAGTWGVIQDDRNIGVMDLTYANGQHDGQSYIHTMGDFPTDIIGTTSMGRQVITPAADKEVTGVGVRVLRKSGSGALVIRLETAAGALIESVSIPSSEIPIGTGDIGTRYGYWVYKPFTTNRLLTAGSTYHLRFSTDSSTNYWMAPNREGYDSGDNGGSGNTTGLRSFQFREGGAQETTNSGGSWAAPYTFSPVDYQFYFTTDVAGPADPTGTLLVVENKLALTSGDTALRDRLLGLGHTVEIVSDDDAEPVMTGVTLLVIAESCSSVTLGNKYSTYTGPVLTFESFHWDALGLTTGNGVGVTASDAFITAHAISTGLTPGNNAIFLTSGTFLSHSGASHGVNAQQVARHTGLSEWSIFAYEDGATLADGSTATSRMVAFGALDAGVAAFSANGWLLFDNAVDWVLSSDRLVLPTRLGAASVLSPSVQGGAVSLSVARLGSAILFSPLVNTPPNVTVSRLGLATLFAPNVGLGEITIHGKISSIHIVGYGLTVGHALSEDI